MKTSQFPSRLAVLFSILLAAGAVGEAQIISNAPPVVLVDGSTSGYYNNSLGTILDGTAPQFPLPLASGGGDPLIYPADEPNLAAATNQLGNWLTPHSVLNANWQQLATIPAAWSSDTETAIIYEINGGAQGFTNLFGDFDADNGLFVWVNGQYKFGARAPGLPSPAGQFEYTNVFLGNLTPGTNRIQILREDNYSTTGYQVRITGSPNAGTAPSCGPAPAGLVGWWPAAGGWQDVIGGNHALPQFGASFTNGEVGQSFNFHGIDQVAQVANAAALNPTNALTLEAWFYVNEYSPNDGVVLFGKDGAHSDRQYLVGLGEISQTGETNVPNTWVARAHLSVPGQFKLFNGRTVIEARKWYHVAMTYNGLELRLYVNGVLDRSEPLTGPIITTSQPLLIGGSVPGPWNFNGRIDELSLYNRALTSNEVAAIYTAGAAGKCPPSLPFNPADGLIAHYPFSGDASDVSGNGNHGIPSNAVLATDRFGSPNAAFRFNGQNAAITVPDNSALRSLTSNYTFNAWVRFGSNPQIDAAILMKSAGAGDQSKWTFWQHVQAPPYGIGLLLNRPPGGQFQWNNNYPFTTNQWFMVTFSASAANTLIAVDGQIVSAQSGNLVLPDTTGFAMSIGGAEPGGNQWFTGLLDDLRIYNRTFSSNDVAQLYQLESAQPPVVVTVVPVITSFNPTVATIGSTVLISGTNFSPVAASNIVYFGGVRASVTAASVNSLTVTVPSGAIYAPITVTVDKLTAAAPSAFLPSFAGNGSNITSSSFAPGQNLTVADGPFKTIIADIDGDGKPDLVEDNAYAHNISLFRNISVTGTLDASSFASRVDFPALGGTDSPRCMAVADVDGDGKLDVLVGDQATSSVIVYRNIATPGTLTTGSLAAPVSFAAGSYPHGLRVADLNGDGRPEILVANHSSNFISILRNLGTAGSLTTNSFAPQYALATGPNPTDVAIADFNGDGKPDLVTTAFGGSQLSVFRNVAASDAAVSNWFTLDTTLPALAGSMEFAVADLDGDAKSDLVVASVHGYAVSVYRNQAGAGAFSSNSFAARVDFGTPGWVHNVAVGDFNGDGKPDLAATGELDSYMAVFQNQSTPGSFTTGSLATRVDYLTGWNAWGVAVGDLDGDNRADIVFANSYDDTLTFYRNTVPFGQTNPPISCVNPPSGLVSWWKAENDAVDLINGHNGTLLNGTTFTPGEVGQGFGFNGTDSYVNIPSSEALKPTGAFAFEAWIKHSGNPGAVSSYCVAAKGIDAEAAMDWALTVSANHRLRPHVTVNGNWHYFDCATPLSAGTWYHVALIYDGQHLQGYVNGSLDGSANVPGAVQTSDAPLRLGAYAPVNGTGSKAFFTGSIDEVAFYNRALGANEIAGIFLAGSAGKCPPATLPPGIAQQPQSLTTNVSANVRFEVVATGFPAPAYQWFFGNDPLPSQTNAMLILSNVQPAQAGLYSVLVSNIAGAVFSSNAVLTIDLTQPAWLVDATSPGFYNDSLGTTLDGTAPQFPLPFGSGGGDPEFYPADEPNLAAGAAILGNWLTNPAALNAYWRSVILIPTTWELNTETAIIYAVDGGNHGVSNLRADIDADNGIYVWVNGRYKFGARQPGLPSPLGQYEYTNVFLGALAPGTNYVQILREDSGIADGYQFRLSGTVLATNQPPIITQSPATQSAAGGNTVTFNGAAIGSADLMFQWQFNGIALAGQSNTTLTLANVQLAHAGAYSFTATNPYGAATSAVATLTVLAFPPVLTRQPTNVTVIESTAASFSVQATGSVTLAYQWLFNNLPLAGKTTATLAFSSVQFNNAGNYSVIITNPYGAVTSSVAVLTVNPRPPCAPVHDGLVSWWRGENNTLDGWDSNNGPTQTSGYRAGKVGQAFSSASIAVPDSASLAFTNELTIEGWINPATTSGFNLIPILIRSPQFPQGGSGFVSSYLLGLTNQNRLSFSVGVTSLTSTQSIPVNVWTHVAASYSAATGLRLFINGQLVSSRAYNAGIPLIPGTTYIGASGISSGVFGTFPGLLDEVSLYQRALSAAEIQSIFNADLTGKCLAPPILTQQPQSQAVPLGEDVKLTATVLGSRPLTYRWKLNGTNLPNATNAFLMIEKIKTNQAGPYTVAVTNSVGFTLSVTAQISLLPAPACTEMLPGLISWWPGNSNTLDAMGLNNITTYSPLGYPTGKVASAFTFNGINSRITINNSTSLNFGSNANFSIEMWIKVNASNTTLVKMPLLEKRFAAEAWTGYSLSLSQGRLAFALSKDSSPAASLFVSGGPDLRDAMFHHVAVTVNRAGTNGGVLYVDGSPVLTFNPTPLNLSLVSVDPLYIGAPAYTRTDAYYSGLIDEPAIYNRNLTAAEILSIRTVGAAGRCTARPVIVTQPVGGTVAQGSNFTLTVAATGIPAPRYQWRLNTAPLSGATNSSLTLTNLSKANIGTYSVIVSNAFGSVISSNAVVAILANKSPFANADALTTPSNTLAVFPVAKLTLNDTDADGDALVVTSVSTNSAQNGTVSLVSGLATYSPRANFVGNDTFTYTIGDGRGGTAVGTVMATVGAGGAAPLNIVSGPLIEGGQFVVRFAGIPGLTYTIETSPSLNGAWLKVANVTAPVTDAGLGIGVFEFRETVTNEGARYYRTVYPSH